ncbi:MAG TPA: hypothetical protein VIK18_25070 [Pirellulales bacterium]
MDVSPSGDRTGPPGNPAGDSQPLSLAVPANSTPAAGPAEAMLSVDTGWDHALAAAMHDVPLPPGLSARLLARLPQPTAAADRRSAGRWGAGRRRWLQAAAASLACAASLLVAILFFNQTAPEMGSESVMESVRAWHNHQAAAGPLNQEAPPEDYSTGSFVMPGCVAGWRRLPAPLLGRDGVAYQLLGPHQNRATLYVLDFDGPRSAPRLMVNTSSPLGNLLTTDGQTSSTWTDGVRLYVLVADGNEQDFRALVRAPRSMA